MLGVDRDKVDDALEVTELSERDVYEIEELETRIDELTSFRTGAEMQE